MQKVFGENEYGVHLMNPNSGNEITMCGDSYEGFENQINGQDSFGFIGNTDKKVVTCAGCAFVIMACRSVNISLKPNG